MRIKKKTSKNMNNSKNAGITLIALVITIIILLILAGVAIASLTGENGLLNRAVGAKTSTEEAQEKEQLQMEVYGSYEKNGDLDIGTVDENIKRHISGVTTDGATVFPLTVTYTGTGNKYTIDGDGNVTKVKTEVAGGETGAGEMPTVTVAPTAAVDKNTQYKDENEDIAVIPKGFRVSSHKDSNNEYDEQTIETGLVVLDGNDNEWVWIPVSVSEAATMYTKVNEGSEIAIKGGYGKTYVSDVATSYYSNTILSNITRGLPNTTSYREPDVVVGSNGTSYDGAKTNRTTAGFTKTVEGTTTTMTLSEMAQSFVDDYEEMVESVKDNHGFYVGRYELKGTDINNAEEKAGAAMTNKTWYQLYYACKHINTGTATVGVVEPRMIWGCQWDMVCNFIAYHGDKKNIKYSEDWGNYSNSTGNAAISGKNGSKQDTGFSSYWCANKIYDIAGNCMEYTQEAYYLDSRACRGGVYGNTGTAYPASDRGGINMTSSIDHLSSRSQLYIK